MANVTVTDEYIRDRSPEDYAKIQQYQTDWQNARAEGDQAGMTAAHDGAEAIRAKYSYSGGADGSKYIPIQSAQTPAEMLQAEQVDYDALAEDLAAQTQASYDAYAEQMAEAQKAQEAAIQAAIQQNVNALESQKSGVKQAGADADQAAYKAYMEIMNPNGALAEQLAARGLTRSGYSESSMVSAGNTLQTGLQENLREVNRQLHEIDLAIEQAKLTGDMQSAEQLAAYRQQVAEQGLALQQQLTSIGMWGAEQSAAQNQQNFQNALAEAELTGNYGGQQLPSAKMEELELEYYRYYLDIYKKTGMSQAQAELAAAEEAAKAAKLNNQYMQGQIGY